MSRKSLILTLIAMATLFAALIPAQVRAGGVCGGAYTIDKGDTVEKLASMCGTTASAIYAANPGLKEPLSVGQAITIPGANFGVTPTTVTPVPTAITPTPTGAVINNYNTYNTYNYYTGAPAPLPSNPANYVVQAGDTFAGIAYSFGVSIIDLWSANPSVVDINILYVGQVLNIPFWSNPSSSIAPEPVALSYKGTISSNAPEGTVRLVNKANAEVYVSLRITRADGTNAIYEYPVKKTVAADVPVGWIDYVAWVGGDQYTGGFKLSEGSTHTLTFNKSKVVVD